MKNTGEKYRWEIPVGTPVDQRPHSEDIISDLSNTKRF